MLQKQKILQEQNYGGGYPLTKQQNMVVEVVVQAILSLLQIGFVALALQLPCQSRYQVTLDQ